MVFKKIQLKKGDCENAAIVQEELDEENDEPCNMALVVVLLGVTVTFVALLTSAVVLHQREQRLKSCYERLYEIKTLYYKTLASLEDISTVVSCYYNMPDPTLKDTPQLMPADIHPLLCTHINVAFAQIIDNEIHLEDYQREIISDVVKLKETNPRLKVLLSVGGAGSHSGFSEMVFNHTCRKTFIRSIKYTLRNLSLDGVDLDWEFPVIDLHCDSSNRQRQHFSQLLREIRREYSREMKDYVLTVAVAAPQIIADAAYDVDQINLYVDFVNLMTYDFHLYNPLTPLTGLNSPLYPRPSEQLYWATLNIDYTVQMYKSKGLDPSKIVVGIPTYGHTFSLVNNENTKVGSPARGFGGLGELGFINYPDICNYLNDYQNESTIIMDNDAKVPYFYRKSEWVSYDNLESVIEKAKYIRDNELRGAMIYSLNADDYDGVCGAMTAMSRFPLSVSIRNTLKGM